MKLTASAMDKKKFVIIANPRTGSNYFLSLLNAHRDITCHSEVFHRDAVYMYGKNNSESLQERNADPILFLNNLYNQSSSICTGFKIFNNHSQAVLNHLIDRSDVKKIILYRSNYLAVYSSEKIAESTQEYISTKHSDSSLTNQKHIAKNQVKIIFNQQEFEKRFKNYVNFYNETISKINGTRQSYCFVRYDECLNKELVARLFTFLDIETVENFKSSFTKQNTSNIINRFSNPEVEDLSKGNKSIKLTHEGFIAW